jgi:hypothetical protein
MTPVRCTLLSSKSESGDENASLPSAPASGANLCMLSISLDFRDLNGHICTIFAVYSLF